MADEFGAKMNLLFTLDNRIGQRSDQSASDLHTLPARFVRMLPGVGDSLQEGPAGTVMS